MLMICYIGKLDGETCSFKIDMGCNILNSKLVGKDKERIRAERCNLRYPTGEKVSIVFKVNVEVQIVKYSKNILMFGADINDDYLLEVDFLKTVDLANIFESVFEPNKEKGLSCSRVEDSSKKVSPVLKELYES